MAIRLEHARSVRFDENLPLYGWLEDVDFSHQLSRTGKIVDVSAVAGVHLGIKMGRTPGKKFGYSQIVNPIYLIQKGSMKKRHALFLMPAEHGDERDAERFSRTVSRQERQALRKHSRIVRRHPRPDQSAGGRPTRSTEIGRAHGPVGLNAAVRKKAMRQTASPRGPDLRDAGSCCGEEWAPAARSPLSHSTSEGQGPCRRRLVRTVPEDLAKVGVKRRILTLKTVS